MAICGTKLHTHMITVLPMAPQNWLKTVLFGSKNSLKFSKPTRLLFRILSQPIASENAVRKVKMIGYSWKMRKIMKNGATKEVAVVVIADALMLGRGLDCRRDLLHTSTPLQVKSVTPITGWLRHRRPQAPGK